MAELGVIPSEVVRPRLGRDKGPRQVGMSPGKEQTSQQPYLPV